MVFKRIVRSIIGVFHRLEDWSEPGQDQIYEAKEAGQESSVDEIHSIWDYLKFRPNTQAFHLANAFGFDEWVDMNEIRNRIKTLFGAEYKNERSLYPYLKTLTDIGLMENSSIGGRMQWRKHDLLIKVEKREETERPVVVAVEGKKKKERGKEDQN